MDYMKILQEVDELSKSGLYDESQIVAIKKAYFRDDFDEKIIMDPSIPGNIMEIYIKLSGNKVNVSEYINEKWHLRGFDAEQLYSVIFYHSRGYDVSDITPNMSNSEIREIMNKRVNEKEIQELLEGVDDEQITFLKNANIDLSVMRFLVNKYLDGYDLTPFLRPTIKEFSLEQIRYLFSVYDVYGDIEKIFNSSLSVEQMKEISINSGESKQFLEDITEIHNNRKYNK